MKSINPAWECFIDVLFNSKKKVPIELVLEFRRLAKLFKLENYCDFLRGTVLSETLLQDPWEWKWLDDLSKILPRGINVLILKGASARIMDLYPYPGLRESSDLDIFIYKIEDYDKQKCFLESLAQKLNIELNKNWQTELKKLKVTNVKYKDQSIDIHFKLFSPLGNFSSFGPFKVKQNKLLEEKIMKSSISFKDYKNLRTMCFEDFWLYNTFHFIKEFPISSLRLAVDMHQILLTKKSSLKSIELRASETNQLFLYKVGVYILNQFCSSLENEVKINFLNKFIFNTRRLLNTNFYSIKCRLIDSYSKGSIITNGNCILSIIYGSIYFLLSNSILSTIESNPFNIRFLNNLYIKFLYAISKLKNKAKELCLKVASNKAYGQNINPEIQKTNKKLITLQIQDIKFTFNVPEEFYKDLSKIWNGFLTEEHLNNYINVEKIINEDLTELHASPHNNDPIYSNDFVYSQKTNFQYGKVNLDSTGIILAKDFWDVRTFALYLIRAMTFKRDDLLLVHASGVKVKDKAIIFLGGSSAGKTTFFNLLVGNEVSGINDDTILLKNESGIWYAYPTPFMSNKESPVICKKSKLIGIIDLIKVCGGHEISPLDKDYVLAILLNSTRGGFIIDDAGFITSKLVLKIMDLSRQIHYLAKVKFSLEGEGILRELINKWLENPKEKYQHGSNFIRLIELRGRSMEPVFKSGDILKVEEIYPDKLKPRDIICFTNDLSNLPIVHRIKYLIKHTDQITVITKGDGNLFEEPPSIFQSNNQVLRVTGKL